MILHSNKCIHINSVLEELFIYNEDRHKSYNNVFNIQTD